MSALTPNSVHRRQAIASAFRAVGIGALTGAALDARQQVERNAPIAPKDNLKITKLETFLVKPRWLFLKIHTNAGIVGLGEPITEGRALTCAEAVKEIEPYLVGKDPRPVGKHW
jgi:galactonate dehydratase